MNLALPTHPVLIRCCAVHPLNLAFFFPIAKHSTRPMGFEWPSLYCLILGLLKKKNNDEVEISKIHWAPSGRQISRRNTWRLSKLLLKPIQILLSHLRMISLRVVTSPRYTLSNWASSYSRCFHGSLYISLRRLFTKIDANVRCI